MSRHRHRSPLFPPWIALGVVSILAAAPYRAAQAVHELLVYEVEAQLSAAQKQRLAEYRVDPTSVAIHVVTIDIAGLAARAGVGLRVEPEGTVVDLKTENVHQRSATSYSWFGVGVELSAAGENKAVLLVENDIIVGSLRIGGIRYRLRPLGEGRHALIRVRSTSSYSFLIEGWNPCKT